MRSLFLLGLVLTSACNASPPATAKEAAPPPPARSLAPSIEPEATHKGSSHQILSRDAGDDWVSLNALADGTLWMVWQRGSKHRHNRIQITHRSIKDAALFDASTTGCVALEMGASDARYLSAKEYRSLDSIDSESFATLSLTLSDVKRLCLSTDPLSASRERATVTHLSELPPFVQLQLLPLAKVQ